MADGRRRDEWRRTARLAQVIANAHRDPKLRPRPYTDADFNDYAPEKSPERRVKMPITVLRSIFIQE